MLFKKILIACIGILGFIPLVKSQDTLYVIENSGIETHIPLVNIRKIVFPSNIEIVILNKDNTQINFPISSVNYLSMKQPLKSVAVNSLTITNTLEITTYHGDLMLTASTNDIDPTIQWSIISGDAYASLTDNVLTAISNGKVTIKATSQSGYTRTAIVKVSGQTLIPNSINEIEDFQFQIFPNPVVNELHIKGLQSNELEFITIYNCLGNVFIKEVQKGVVNVSDLKNGYYLCEIQYNHKTSRIWFFK